MSQQQDRPKYAFVSEPEYPDGGKVKQRIKLSFKVEQLEAMKEFVTDKGNVNATVVILHEGFPFLDVYNPAETSTRRATEATREATRRTRTTAVK